RIALAVARRALDVQPTQALPSIKSLQAALRSGDVPGSEREATFIAGQLDSAYLDLLDAGGTCQTPECERAFLLARAAAAAAFALGPDPTAAAIEATYEAPHVHEDDAALREAVLSAVGADSGT